jgi:hypothetical protein
MSAALHLQSDLIAEFDGFLKLGSHDVGITFEVYGIRRPGYPGSRETPAEPSYVDVFRVMANGRDVTDMLQDDGFAKAFFGELYAR